MLGPGSEESPGSPVPVWVYVPCPRVGTNLYSSSDVPRVPVYNSDTSCRPRVVVEYLDSILFSLVTIGETGRVYRKGDRVEGMTYPRGPG